VTTDNERRLAILKQPFSRLLDECGGFLVAAHSTERIHVSRQGMARDFADEVAVVQQRYGCEADHQPADKPAFHRA